MDDQIKNVKVLTVLAYELGQEDQRGKRPFRSWKHLSPRSDLERELLAIWTKSYVRGYAEAVELSQESSPILKRKPSGGGIMGLRNWLRALGQIFKSRKPSPPEDISRGRF